MRFCCQFEGSHVGNGFGELFTCISEVRFCMMAQMSLVSLGVKMVSPPLGVENLVMSSMAALMWFWIFCGSSSFGCG